MLMLYKHRKVSPYPLHYLAPSLLARYASKMQKQQLQSQAKEPELTLMLKKVIYICLDVVRYLVAHINII